MATWIGLATTALKAMDSDKKDSKGALDIAKDAAGSLGNGAVGSIASGDYKEALGQYAEGSGGILDAVMNKNKPSRDDMGSQQVQHQSMGPMGSQQAGAGNQTGVRLQSEIEKEERRKRRQGALF